MNHACRNRQEEIADHVLGVLSQEQTKALEDHLSGCAGCRQYLEDLVKQGQGLASFAEDVGAGMTARCEKVIEALGDVVPAEPRSTWLVPLMGRLVRTAVAAVLILGAGIALGRFTAPRPVDVEQLRADVQAEMGRRLDAALAANNTQLAAEVGEQMRQDLRLFATDLMSGTQTLVDRRFAEVVQLIEAGRLTDRRQVARALDQIKTHTGMGFRTLAALTEETPATLQN